MPIITSKDLQGNTFTGNADVKVESNTTPIEKESPSFLDTAKAFYKLEDPFFNAIGKSQEREFTFENDPDFDPISKLENDNPELLENIDSFKDVGNEDLYNLRVERVNKENKYRETLKNSSTMNNLLAGVATSVIDPLILIPGFNAAKAGSIGKGIAKGALGVGTIEGASQASLMGTQETRTKEEALTNTLAATALGGVFGAGLSALSKSDRAASELMLKSAIKGEDVKLDPTFGKSTAGAAQVNNDFGKEALGLANINERFAKYLSGPIEALRAPDLRMITSQSGTTRRLGEVLFNSNFIRKKNLEGEATLANAQNLIARRDDRAFKLTSQIDKLYTEYTGKGNFASNVDFLRGNKLNNADFQEEIWKNLTRKNYEGDIPQAKKAASFIRTEMDSHLAELQRRNLIGDIDPEFAKTYLTRIYDSELLKVPANQKTFVNRVANWLKTHHKDGKLRDAPLEGTDALEFAEDILSAIQKEHPDQIALSGITQGMISKGKFTKDRQLLIPDEIIEDFLVKDASAIYSNYSRRAGRLIEVDDALKRAGFESIEDAVGQLKSEKASAILKLETKLKAEGKSLKDINIQTTKLAKEFEDSEELMRDGYSAMLGQLAKPTPKAVKVISSYQFTRLLGGVALSSLPEFVSTALRPGGLLNTIKYGYLPMLRSLKTSRIAKNQLSDVSLAVEMQQNNILKRWVDPTDDLRSGLNPSKIEKAADAASAFFAKASGSNRITLFTREVAAQTSAAQTIRTIKKDILSAEDITNLAAIGIGKEDIPGLKKAISRHVEEHKGSFIPNFDNWTDTALRDKLKNGIMTELESSVLKPGAESLPIVIQKYPWARLLWQFKSYMSASTNKITLSALQRRDAASLTGMVTLLGSGILVSQLQDLASGRDTEEDMDKLVLEGISRSGLLGLWGTSVLDMGITMNDPKRGRFAGKYGMSVVTGPSVSQIQDLFDTVKRTTDGDLTEQDRKAIMRMLPYQNLFYTRRLAEQLVED